MNLSGADRKPLQVTLGFMQSLHRQMSKHYTFIFWKRFYNLQFKKIMEAKQEIKKIDEIKDIQLQTESSNQGTIDLLNGAIQIAAAIIEHQTKLKPTISLAIQASMQTVTALLVASNAKCNLSTPPEDIDVKIDSSGKMIYRCYHTPAHEWDLSGNKLP
jgi:hypothetical protein